MRRKLGIAIAASCVLLLAWGPPSKAEEVAKKLRASVSVGWFNNRDRIPSDAANTMNIVDSNDVLIDFVEDPRNDSAAFGSLELRTAGMLTGGVSYALNRIFVVEATAGYQRGDVANIEVQGEPLSFEVSSLYRNRYTVIEVPAGTLTQVPVQITAIARFRPKARLNPYFGIGAGYTFVGFESSKQLNQLSERLSSSTGHQVIVPGFYQSGGGGTYTDPCQTTPCDARLTGATIEAPDSFEWHLAGGMEYNFRRKWHVYGDIRYVQASRAFHIGFNGSDSLGVSVPDRRALDGDAYAKGSYGPMMIVSGGLYDLGQWVWPVDENPTTPLGRCTPTNPAEGGSPCNFLVNDDIAKYNKNAAKQAAKEPSTPRYVPIGPDGTIDTGRYFAKGGKIRYGGTSFQFGVRFTF